MNVSIPPEFVPRVDRLVAAGTFPTTEALIRAALQQLLERHDRFEVLRGSIQEAIDEFDRGEGKPFNADEIKRRGRELLAASIRQQ